MQKPICPTFAGTVLCNISELKPRDRNEFILELGRITLQEKDKVFMGNDIIAVSDNAIGKNPPSERENQILALAKQFQAKSLFLESAFLQDTLASVIAFAEGLTSGEQLLLKHIGGLLGLDLAAPKKSPRIIRNMRTPAPSAALNSSNP